MPMKDSLVLLYMYRSNNTARYSLNPGCIIPLVKCNAKTTRAGAHGSRTGTKFHFHSARRIMRERRTARSSEIRAGALVWPVENESGECCFMYRIEVRIYDTAEVGGRVQIKGEGERDE